jgi:hypothetical protein
MGASGEGSEGRADEAAQNMISESRLLPGEPEDTTYGEDACYWASVYRRLIVKKEHIAIEIAESAAELPAPARIELRETDVPAFGAELERFRKRLQFWEARHRQLTG